MGGRCVVAQVFQHIFIITLKCAYHYISNRKENSTYQRQDSSIQKKSYMRDNVILHRRHIQLYNFIIQQSNLHITNTIDFHYHAFENVTLHYMIK